MGTHTFWLSLVTSYICQHYPQVHLECKTSQGYLWLFSGQLLKELNTLARFLLFSRFVDSRQLNKHIYTKPPRTATYCRRRQILPASKCEADDMDSPKMETPLCRQTLDCDNCYLITAREGTAALLLFFLFCVNTLGKQIFQWLASLRFNPYGAFCLSPNRQNSSTKTPLCTTQWIHRGHTAYHTRASINPLLNYL